jgi:hypothetical protein
MAGFQPQDQDQGASIRDSLAMRQLGATISPKKINKALKPYHLEDTKVKGKTDTELYQMAEGAVVKWWQRQQRSKIRSQDPGKKDTKSETRDLNQMNNKVERALNRIPELDLKAQARAEQRAQEARDQVKELLRGTGLANLKPPPYAMTSVSNLQAWINRQTHRRAAYRAARLEYLG